MKPKNLAAKPVTWDGLALQVCSVPNSGFSTQVWVDGHGQEKCLCSYRDLAATGRSLTWTLDIQPTCFIYLARSKKDSYPELMEGRRRLLEWLAEQLLIAGSPVRIPPKARGISAIPPIFDGCGHS